MVCRSGINTTLSGAVSTDFTPLVRSINGLGIERIVHECTNMSSPVSVGFPNLIMREYAPGDLGTPKQITIGLLFDPDEVGPTGGGGGTQTYPIDAPIELWTIQWRPIGAQVTGASWVWNGFMVSFDAGDITYDGLMEGSAIFQPTGDIVMTRGTT